MFDLVQNDQLAKLELNQMKQLERQVKSSLQPKVEKKGKQVCLCAFVCVCVCVCVVSIVECVCTLIHKHADACTCQSN